MLSFLTLFNQDYIVEIKTGDRIGAGTDANVYIILFDEIGRSTPVLKLSQTLKNSFEKGSTDRFEIPTSKTKNFNKDGEISKIEFWRDCNGLNSDWYVDKIEVKNRLTKSTFLFPVNRWVNANYHYKIRHLDTSLPQHEPETMREARRQEIVEKRKNYVLDQKFPKEFPNGPVQVKSLPDDEQFSFNEKFSLAKLKVHMTLATTIINITRSEWKSIADLSSVFVSPDFPKPERSSLWMDDTYFGFQRLNGVNPSVIRLVKSLPDKFPVTNDHVRPFLGGLTIEDAIDQKRLFICDYEILEDLPVQKDMVKPGPQNPIFTPNCPSLTWTLVKMWFNNADSAHHQALTHLGFTHLLMESFSLATQRNLSHSHPVYKIMAPHFMNIIAINSLAISELVSAGGWVDQTMNYGKEGMFALVVKGYKDWRLDVDGTLPEDLKTRGLDDPNILPCYFYREDALRVYDAINKYVHDYLTLYYTTPETVSEDFELQNWVQELVKERNSTEGGMGIKGIPGNGTLSAVDQLQQIVTSVIFTCSVAHAAANFPQYDEYAYVPNYPVMMLGKPPTDPKAIVTEQDILKCLPNKEKTLTIMTMTKLLSNKGTNSLGDFEVQHIVEPKALAVVQNFRGDIAEIIQIIKARNKERFPKYKYLDPEFIPNSISI